ncbi:MAG: prepilin peptidase [Rhodospirillales bacterium]|nr:prepilin peptidase [Rhodospirillales bacterium]
MTENAIGAILTILWWVPILAAPFIGSFLGVVVERLPEGEPLVFGRSRCDYCGHTLAVRDLIPLVSWFAAQRRCRYCGTPLGWFYPNIEVAALLVAIWAALTISGPMMWVSCGLGWALLTLAVIDIRHLILPDVITLPLLAGGLVTIFAIDPSMLDQHALAAVLGFGVFWLIATGYRKLRGQEGLGLGDAKLLAAAGAWVSWQGLPGVVFFGAASALLVVLLRIALGADIGSRRHLPFGPYLCLATWLVWLYGPLLLG